jgi:protein involved in ribonucleotide reduction
MIVYFSSLSSNTQRFVQKLALPSERITESLVMDTGYVLITPTFNGKIPVEVEAFLANEQNRSNLQGVVAAGNRNFGANFARAGYLISQLYQVPLLHTFEVFGLPEDVNFVKNELEALWSQAI